MRRTSVLLVLVLAACGGGGGGGSSSAPSTGVPTGAVTITSGNQTQVAHDASGAMDASSTISSVPTGVVASAGRVSLRSAIGIVSSLVQDQATATPALPVGAITTATNPCPTSGSYTVTANKNADGTGTASLSFNSCSEVDTTGSQITLNGPVSATVNSISGSAFNMTMSFTNFSVTENAATESFNGTLSLVGNSAGGTTTVTLATPAGSTLTYTEGSTNTVQLSDYSVTVSEFAGGSYRLTGQGKVASTGMNGQVTFATPTAFSGVLPNGPTAGVMTVTGGTGAIRITAQPSRSFLVELDANGDGTYEASRTVAQL